MLIAVDIPAFAASMDVRHGDVSRHRHRDANNSNQKQLAAAMRQSRQLSLPKGKELLERRFEPFSDKESPSSDTEPEPATSCL